MIDSNEDSEDNTKKVKYYKIIKSKPLPRKLEPLLFYPFADMKVNDCFQLPYNTKTQTKVMYYANAFCKKNNLDWKFVTRTVIEYRAKRTYCWRIK